MIRDSGLLFKATMYLVLARENSASQCNLIIIASRFRFDKLFMLLAIGINSASKWWR